MISSTENLTPKTKNTKNKKKQALFASQPIDRSPPNLKTLDSTDMHSYVFSIVVTRTCS